MCSVPDRDSDSSQKARQGRAGADQDANNDERRVIDPHALRTTLDTQPARAGVTPKVAQRIMRLSEYRTTSKHYTVLGLTDTAAAIATRPLLPQPYCQQLGRETQRLGEPERNEPCATGTDATDVTPTKNAPYGASDAKRATGIEPATFSLEG